MDGYDAIGCEEPPGPCSDRRLTEATAGLPDHRCPGTC